MQIYRTSDYRALSRKAAGIIAAQVILKPDCTLGLATGGTPRGAYEKLIEWHQSGALDFSRVSAFTLDEYFGLPRNHPQSYAFYMQNTFYSHINIDPGNVSRPNGLPDSPEQECARYDAAIVAAGGIDLQLLGLGGNGHIGFNEPSGVFNKNTFCVDLAESTIIANSRYFANSEDIPKRAITMGIGSIMRAKKILLVVSGEQKAGIVYKAFFGPITPAVPASILQLHPDVCIVGDEAALSMLPPSLAGA